MNQSPIITKLAPALEHPLVLDHPMSLAPPPGNRNRSSLGSETFDGFFERWLQEQERDLEELVSAARSHAESTRSESDSDTESTRSLRALVDRVMAHYENYYRVKFESVRRDVLSMLTPTWRSSLEEAFMWVGGWRPSMAVHLLYSASGLQFEAGLNELLEGLSTGDLGDLSPSQLDRVDDLQRDTIKAEKALTESLAAHQETVADTSMVELAHVVTELTRTPNSVSRDPVEERVNSALTPKEKGLEEILHMADDLRLSTLRNLLEILSPIQAVHYLIAAAELHLRVHEWGLRKDAQAHGGGGRPRPNP